MALGLCEIAQAVRNRCRQPQATLECLPSVETNDQAGRLDNRGPTFAWSAAGAGQGTAMADTSLGISAPVTEQQTSAARWQALLAAAVDGVVSIDEQGRIQTFNPAAERMFGYRAEEVIGRNVSLLMPSPYREEHDQYIARYLATGEKHIIGIGREIVAQRRDGTVFPVELSVAEARVDGDRIFVGVIRDITQRKQAEAELHRSHEELQRLVAELRQKNEEIQVITQQLWQAAKLASVGEMAASIAHELNNPLATNLLRLETVLERLPQEDPNRRPLEIVQQETRRMSKLVSELLQFARRGRDRPVLVDVNRELEHIVELVRHMIRKRGIEIGWDLDPKLPSIQADLQKLQQVFLNLLTNAADAMPSGGHLLLRTRQVHRNGDDVSVVIEISDTGVGIPEENLSHVFDPFFTTKAEGQGTGLGLPICRRIVEEHQGTIALESTPGQGTTARVVLPQRQPETRPQGNRAERRGDAAHV